MPSVRKIVASMRGNPRNVRYADLFKVCEHYFGQRTATARHMQSLKPRGLMLAAIGKLEESNGEEA